MCRDGGRRGLEAETDAEVIESENWKLNIEENVVGLPLWKGKEACFFLVPEGRFSGGQEGDSWWDENRNGLKKAFIYAGCKQICLSTGNDLATFRVSLTE